MTPQEARERFGISYFHVKKAQEIADTVFKGEADAFELGIYWVHASGFAVCIDRGNPESRKRWNEAWARGRLAQEKA